MLVIVSKTGSSESCLISAPVSSTKYAENVPMDLGLVVNVDILHIYHRKHLHNFFILYNSWLK